MLCIFRSRNFYISLGFYFLVLAPAIKAFFFYFASLVRVFFDTLCGFYVVHFYSRPFLHVSRPLFFSLALAIRAFLSLF